MPLAPGETGAFLGVVSLVAASEQTGEVFYSGFWSLAQAAGGELHLAVSYIPWYTHPYTSTLQSLNLGQGSALSS